MVQVDLSGAGGRILVQKEAGYKAYISDTPRGTYDFIIEGKKARTIAKRILAFFEGNTRGFTYWIYESPGKTELIFSDKNEVILHDMLRAKRLQLALSYPLYSSPFRSHSSPF